MKIDWFTFTAQIFNFLVLVWLLKKLLYQPILNAIEVRELSIVDRITAANEREAEANQMIEDLQAEKEKMNQLRQAQLKSIEADIDQLRRKKESELDDEISAMRAKWQQAIEREQGTFLGELRERVAREVQELTRHLMKQLADDSLEARCVEKFREQLADSALERQHRSGSEPIVLRTAFELTPEHQSSLESDIRTKFDASAVEFEVDQTLICGIEMIVGHEKLQWNVDSELDQMEQGLMKMLRSKTQDSAPARN